MLWGVHMVNNGFSRAFGTALRRVISNSTSNRFKAFGVGVVVSAVLQSSTATAMVVSSFAARSIITITGAIALMLGADVGSTLAAQALSFDLSWLTPVLLTSGFILNKQLKNSQYKHVGRAMIGVGLVLVSLAMIKTVAEPLKESEAIHVLVVPLTEEPVLAVIVGAFITWMVHSALGMVLLFMSFTTAGMISVPLGFALVLGANLGSAFAPVAMTLRDIPAGRRVPLGNLLMRGLGVVICIPMLRYIGPYIEMMDPDPARQLVNFHTIFNLGLAVLFLPLITPMTKLSEFILPDRPREEDESLPRYLDPSAIKNPTAALACVSRETLRISDIVLRMMRDTLETFRTNNPKLVQEIRDREATVDGLYEAVKTYLARLSGQQMDEKESRRYMQILTFSTNLEHIGDIVDKSLLELADKKIRNQDNFSKEGFNEIAALHNRVVDGLQLAQNVFMTGDVKMARQLFEDKATLRNQEMLASESHFKRLSEGVAETVATSSLHLDILRDLRRINSYTALIAYPILEDADELEPSRLKKRRTKKPARPKKDAAEHKSDKKDDKQD